MCFLRRRGSSLGGTRGVLPNVLLCISEKTDDSGNMQIKTLFIMMSQPLEIIASALLKLRHKSIEHTSGKPPTITTVLPAFQVQVLKWTGYSGSKSECAHGDKFLWL